LTADDLTDKRLPPDAALSGFQQAHDFVQRVEPYDVETLGQGLRQIGEKVVTNNKASAFLGKMRLAVTRQQVSPPLFESMVALGRQRTLVRLDEVLTLFNQSPTPNL
jgi:glutamyl-tRNA synthetase